MPTISAIPLMSHHVFDLQFDMHARLHTYKRVPPVFMYMHTHPWMEESQIGAEVLIHTLVPYAHAYTLSPGKG